MSEAALGQHLHGCVLEERAAPEALVGCAWSLRLLHDCICLGMVLQAGEGLPVRRRKSWCVNSDVQRFGVCSQDRFGVLQAVTSRELANVSSILQRHHKALNVCSKQGQTNAYAKQIIRGLCCVRSILTKSTCSEV